jgi:peroxiredoxin
LGAFARALDKLKEEGISVIAASSDALENSEKIVSEWELNFPMGYGLDPVDISAKLGAFHGTHPRNPEQAIIHGTGFVLRPDNTVAVGLYSTGPIGRLTWQDIMALVQFYKKMAG